MTIPLMCLRLTPQARAKAAIEISCGARYRSARIAPGVVGRLVVGGM